MFVTSQYFRRSDNVVPIVIVEARATLVYIVLVFAAVYGCNEYLDFKVRC